MSYTYKTMEEIANLHTKEDLMFALDLMDMDFEETEEKKELVERLVQAQKDHLHEIFQMASYEDLQALELMSKNEGIFLQADTFAMNKGLFPDSVLELPEELCLVTSKDEKENLADLEIHTSEEFLDLFKAYLTDDQKALAFALDEMARIIKGSLYYYGAVEIDELYKIVAKNYSQLNKNLFKTVLGYKYSLFTAYDSEVFEDREYIKDEFFDMYSEVEDVKKWRTSVKAYKNFERKDLFEAGDNRFIENKESYDLLVDYFKPYFKPSEEDYEEFEMIPAELFGEYIMNNTIELLQRTADHDEVIFDFLEYFAFPNQEVSDNGVVLLTNHANNLSRWDNRGYSPDEILRRGKEKNNVVPMRAWRNKP